MHINKHTVRRHEPKPFTSVPCRLTVREPSAEDLRLVTELGRGGSIGCLGNDMSYADFIVSPSESEPVSFAPTRRRRHRRYA